MIVLDTNVVSEVVRRVPEPRVLNWLDEQTDEFAVTAITIGELWTGVRLLPEGARRDHLTAAIEDVLMRWDTVLPYDAVAAGTYARMRELAHQTGRGLSVEDGMIAAVSVASGASLATRNAGDFDFLPVPLVNPWEHDG